MEKKPVTNPEPADAKKREAEARKKLSRPPRDKTEVTIGPTDRTGPDVVVG